MPHEEKKVLLAFSQENELGCTPQNAPYEAVADRTLQNGVVATHGWFYPGRYYGYGCFFLAYP